MSSPADLGILRDVSIRVRRLTNDEINVSGRSNANTEEEDNYLRFVSGILGCDFGQNWLTEGIWSIRMPWGRQFWLSKCLYKGHH